jgi:beta-carotene 15,15'-dioxygenase
MVHRQLSINMPFARRVALDGMTSVGWFSLPSDRLSVTVITHWIVTAVILAMHYSGVPLTTPLGSTIVCAALLLLGLPHGTLDIALIRQSHRTKNMGAVVALYLGCAAAMYSLWQVAPAAALVLFFGLSISHFAEDWSGRLPPFLAHGTAMALLMAPAMFHSETLKSLFAALVGNSYAGLLTDAAILVAPLSVVIASVGLVSLWRDGYRTLTIATALSLVGMICLPPLVGFALFFCLMHSPTQFSAGLLSLRLRGVRQWSVIVAPLTVAALGIAALIYSRLAEGPVSTSVIISAFVTLSVLTLPHMAVPTLAESFDHHLKRKTK